MTQQKAQSPRDSAYKAGYRDGFEDAILKLRQHAGAEAAARKIATDYVRHVQEAADWLAGDIP